MGFEDRIQPFLLQLEHEGCKDVVPTKMQLGDREIDVRFPERIRHTFEQRRQEALDGIYRFRKCQHAFCELSERDRRLLNAIARAGKHGVSVKELLAKARANDGQAIASSPKHILEGLARAAEEGLDLEAELPETRFCSPQHCRQVNARPRREAPLKPRSFGERFRERGGKRREVSDRTK